MAPSADQILELVAQHAAERHTPPVFDPANPTVPVSGKLIGAPEIVELVRSSLDGWLTAGAEHKHFERKLARAAGLRHALMVNSGSSANLAAVSALMSPRLGEKALQPGDEVITVAAGFPTTVNPIVQNGLVPVFVDVTLPTYDIDVEAMEAAVSDRTRAVVIAHTLGNPFDLGAVVDFCRRHGLMLVEDCCDALGATYHGKPVGTFGDLMTLSFYPAHQITTGEGGAVLMNRGIMKLIVESFRDWAATAGATRAATTPAASDSTSSSGRSRTATTTSTSTRTWATTSRQPTCRPPWAPRSWTGCRSSSRSARRTTPT